MIDESKYIQEMQAGIRNAFDLMASRYPEVEIYTISIWTDDGARKSAISFDTYENSIAKCHAANERRQAMRRQFSASGITAKVPHDMVRNNNPADFKFQKATVIDNKSFTAQGALDYAAWAILERLMDAIKGRAAKESAKLNLHPNAELGVSGRKTWYGSVVKIPED